MGSLKRKKIKYIVYFFLLCFMSKAFSSEKMILIKDFKSGKILFSEGDCNVRYSPFSTFKIPISLMGYDSNVLISKNEPFFIFKDDLVNNNLFFDKWKQDQDPSSWIKNSCVWVSKDIVKRIGKTRFLNYINSFNYGNKCIEKDYDNNTWLGKSLKISVNEQIDFLKKFLDQDLLVSLNSYNMTKDIVFVETLSNGSKLYGKTGLGIVDDKILSWFVGWTERNDRKLMFSCLIIYSEKEEFSGNLNSKNEIKSIISNF